MSSTKFEARSEYRYDTYSDPQSGFTSSFGGGNVPFVIDLGPESAPLRVPAVEFAPLAASYDRATAQRSEMGWEQFAADACARAREITEGEMRWLLERAGSGADLEYRRAVAIARVLGRVSESNAQRGPLCLVGLSGLLKHPVAAVRIEALEAMCEVGLSSAKEFAKELHGDPDEGVRQAAAAILAMTA